MDIESSTGEEPVALENSLLTVEDRQRLRKNSYISKRLNDPKLLEVSGVVPTFYYYNITGKYFLGFEAQHS